MADDLDAQIDMAGTPQPLANVPPDVGPSPASANPLDSQLEQAVAPELQSAKYGTFPQQALTAAESAASVLSGGLSRGAEPIIGQAFNTHALDPEAQEARTKENPVSNIAGGIGGFASGVGVAGAIGSAGTLGSAALGLGEGLGSRAIAGAVKYGIEGALVQGTNEVGKLVTADPNQTLGTAAINMGLSGIIGGGIGGAAGGASALWSSKIAPKLSEALENASQKIAGDLNAPPPPVILDYLGRPINQPEISPDISAPPSAMDGTADHFKTAAKFGLGLLGPKGYLISKIPAAAAKAMALAGPFLKKAGELVGGGEAGELAATKFAATADQGANAEGFQAMANYIKATIKGENALSNGVKNLFEGGKAVLPTTLLPSDKDVEKLDKQLKELQGNSNPLFNVGDKVSHYMPDHGQAMAQTSATAVNYLNGLRPNIPKQNPLDTESKPTAAQNAPFKRALQIAQQPLMALDHVDKGTLLPQDVTTLKTVYPGLYSRMSDKIYNGLIEHIHNGNTVPYTTRIAMSIFLGRPLDSTMTQSSILAAQPQVQGSPSAQPQAKLVSPNHSMKNINKLAGAYATPEQAREASKAGKS